MTESKYLKNVNQIAVVCDCDKKTAKKWSTDTAFPKRTKSGWPEMEVLKYAAKKMAEHARQITGQSADVKRIKIQKQIAKLNEDIRRAKADADMAELQSKQRAAEMMLRRDHVKTLIAHMSIVKRMLERLPGEVAELVRDPAMVKAVREKCNQTMLAIGSECEKEGI
jgi:hypothetical protein